MMRYLFFFLLIVIIHSSVFAQERRTTVLKYPLRFNTFGAPMLELSSVHGQTLLSVGGIGAVVVNKRFLLGGFGQSGSTTVVLSDNHQYQTSLTQGGFVLGYVLRYSRPVHLITSTRLGWALNTFKDITTRQQVDQNGFNITPTVGAEMNVTHFLRVQLMGGYRVVINSTLPQLPVPIDINSVVGTLALSFGRF